MSTETQIEMSDQPDEKEGSCRPANSSSCSDGAPIAGDVPGSFETCTENGQPETGVRRPDVCTGDLSGDDAWALDWTRYEKGWAGWPMVRRSIVAVVWDEPLPVGIGWRVRHGGDASAAHGRGA